MWEPEDNLVYYLLEMNIGFVGNEASDIYTIIVATPEGIMALKEKKQFIPEIQKILLLNSYVWSDVRNIIEDKLSSIKQKHEFSVSDELANCFNWEFYGMR
ncbi:Imm8 family immunity protein [Zophobihabitans entericus]|uniref:Imm8 family immunity protein n=1 Tax=Zophobihabitans entericus TaxID=1635327 RepID=UPI00389ACC13